jgi:hypothetical protein
VRQQSCCGCMLFSAACSCGTDSKCCVVAHEDNMCGAPCFCQYAPGHTRI